MTDHIKEAASSKTKILESQPDNRGCKKHYKGVLFWQWWWHWGSGLPILLFLLLSYGVLIHVLWVYYLTNQMIVANGSVLVTGKTLSWYMLTLLVVAILDGAAIVFMKIAVSRIGAHATEIEHTLDTITKRNIGGGDANGPNIRTGAVLTSDNK